MKKALLCAIALALMLAATYGAPQSRTLPGYVVHFDFISNVKEGRDLVRIAARCSAKVINVVPPAHLWDSPLALKMLDGILDEIARRKLRFVFTRIDASLPPDDKGVRFNYLYGRILTEAGRMPDGKPTPSYFLTTAGRDGYDEWMEEETRYYARHYAQHPGLLGINLGPFSEPFSSQRGGFLEYLDDTQRYEITQYTPYAATLWHRWLAGHFRSIEDLNREYGTLFKATEEIPLPLGEEDPKFGAPQLAYFDFVRTLSDWFVGRYEACRRIWHDEGGNTRVPFILQISGFLAEKLALGRPSFAAFDMPDWIARADALGMSIYTNNGYADHGHASVQATVNLIAQARDLGKDVFVLEGGCEAPNVVLNLGELAFFGAAGRKLNPRTYIYEFLKDKFAEEYSSNPGKPVASDGRIRYPAFKALRRLFSEIASRDMVTEKPELYAVLEPLQARGNLQAGAINSALYDLASDVSIRFVTPAFVPKTRPDTPILRLDASVSPPNDDLTRLMRHIPNVDSADRPAWRRAVLKALVK
jgi:hypothetical protein